MMVCVCFKAPATTEIYTLSLHDALPILSFSDDLLSWTTPRTVLYPDELDPPDYDATHVYQIGRAHV